MTAFGIDFGTTNSVLATYTGGEMGTVSLDEPPQEWAELGFDKVLPTVLADGGSGKIIFGWRAKRSDTRLEAVKRLFATDDEVRVGMRSMKVEEAAGIFFRQIKERATLAGLTVDKAVITVPANSRGLARFRTKVSAGLSGIEVLALLNEPTAAAMAYGQHIKDGERVLVYDFGGGTLDVTILIRSVDGVFIEESSKGRQQLGGMEIDKLLYDALRRRVPKGSKIDPFDLERAKIMLSSKTLVAMPLLGGGVLEIKRTELESVIRNLIKDAEAPLLQCWQDNGSPKIDHLVLVGGTSKIPAVRTRVRDLLRIEPMEGVDPMTAVAEGAALAAGILTGQVDDYDFFVGTEHALGTVAFDRSIGEQSFSVVIPRNTKLPAQATERYHPTRDDQESVSIQVIEGDPTKALGDQDNVVLVEWKVELDPPRPMTEASFDLTYKYDVDGILHVKAVDVATGREMVDREVAFGAATTREELVELRKKVDRIDTEGPEAKGEGSDGTTGTDGGAAAGSSEVAGPGSAPVIPDAELDAESAEIVKRAREKVIPFLDDDEQARFGELIAAIGAAAPDDRSEPRDALAKAIRDHAYLL